MITDEYYKKLGQVESGNDPLAENPKSSAKGRYQFIDSTAKQYGLDKYQFGTKEYAQAEEAAARKLTQDNYDYLKSKLNREPTAGELYLAHQQGAAGAEKILSGDETANAIDVLGRDQVINNGGNENMTLAEFKQKWTSKFNDIDAGTAGIGQPEITIAETNRTDTSTLNAGFEVDPFADFGVKVGSDPDPFADFNVKPDDSFIISSDTVGGLKKSMIDQETGAPSFIRQAVGSLADPESRLETLKKYYPDAQPYDQDNFVYTDPETKRPTLYNPIGFDRGDVASVEREAFVTIGSSVGAFLGGTAGAAASIPTGGTVAPYSIPTGAIAGSGIGAGVAANVWDAWMTITGQTRDVRSVPQVLSETAIETAGSAIGEGLGRALPIMAKEAIGGAKASSRALIAQFERLGIKPTATVSLGGGAGWIEGALAQSPSSADIMVKQADEIVEQSHNALQSVVKKYGKAKTKQGAGDVIVEAAGKAVERFDVKAEKLYDTAFDLVGANTQVQTKSTETLYKDLLIELSNAPESRSKALGPAIERLKSIVADSRTGGLDFETLRAIRTDIGRDLKEPLTSGATSSQNAALKRVYAALTNDMQATAENVGPDAINAIKRADKYKAAFEKTARESLNKILKYDAEERAYRFAMTGAHDGGSSLQKLRKLFTTDEWDDISATVLSNLGDAPANGGFSISHFVTNYNKLAPEAKDALFRGGRYKDAAQSLDDFVDLMGKLKDAKRFENTSNTAGAIQTGVIIQSLGALTVQGVGGAFAGEKVGVGGWYGAIGGIVAPRVAARLITNRAFIKWLSKPVSEGAQEAGAYITKLYLIGEENPEIKGEIDQLINVLEQNTRPENSKENVK